MRHFDHNSLTSSDLSKSHRRLARGYTLALGSIGLLALASLALLVAQINSQGRYARMIDYRESQRVLTLHTAMFSLLLGSEADPHRRAQYRRTISDTLAEIERQQQLLAAEAPGAGGRDDPAGAGLDEQLRAFAAGERGVLARSGQARTGSGSPAASDALEAVPNTLRDAFIDAIEGLRGASLRWTHFYQGLATSAVCLLLLTLVAEARWIFQPLVRGICRETSALAESRQRLDAVFATVGEAIIVADAENVIQTANAEAARVWGYLPEELIGRKLNTLVLAGRELAPTAWRAMFPATNRLETVGTRRDGEPFGLELSLTSTRLQTGPGRGAAHAPGSLFFTISARDISERLEAARLLAQARDATLDAARAKGALVANMSHEIRAPLDGIRNHSSQLAQSELTTAQRQHLESILRHGNALGGVLNDLLDFSNIESGKLTLERADFELRELVEGAADVLAGRAVQKQLELLAYVAPDVPTALRGDAARLRQVLLSLLGNALKFTPRGEVIIEVSLAAEEVNHACLRFSVRDTGIGVAPAERPRLFDPFAPGDESLAPPQGGRGWGLTICRQLVDRMDGEIAVETAPGGGSIFWFTARLEKQAAVAGPASPARRAEEALRARLDGVRVLMVDDNATCRQLVGSQLAAWGMQTATAESGGAALAQLREAALAGDPFEVALLDLNLGSMDGFTLAWAIHSQPMLSRTRLVLMTALGLENDQTAYREVGIVASLSKPLKHDAVLQVLAKVVAEDDPAPLLAARPRLPGVPPARTNRISMVDAPLRTGGRRILLADDNPINRKMALRQLANLGFPADAVANGREALAALRAQPYGLVILDMHMPIMDGYETARAIRRLLPREDHLALIAMTANRTNGDRQRCLEAGMDDYLAKPVRQEELGRMLERWNVSAHYAPAAAAAASFADDAPAG